MTNAEAWFNNSLRPRKPEGSLGRTAQDGHLDSHTAPELWAAQWLIQRDLRAARGGELNSLFTSSAYQPVALPLGQTGPQRLSLRVDHSEQPCQYKMNSLISVHRVWVQCCFTASTPRDHMDFRDGHLDVYTAPEFWSAHHYKKKKKNQCYFMPTET